MTKQKNKQIHSVGEDKIAKILRTMRIKYYREYTFPWLISDKNMPLRLDFYLPKYSKAIEYDGIYHYKKGNARQKQNDRLKDRLCAENGVILLRIPYWQSKYLENILENFVGK